VAQVTGLLCPDCDTVCLVRLVLLTADGRIVLISACPQCADKASIRCYKQLDSRTFREAHLLGLPIVNYGAQP
jgi:hypothetical protein